MIVAYLDHPLGEGNGQATIYRHDNIANATSWFRFIGAAAPAWSLTMPWFAYVAALDDVAYRPRALVAQRMQLERADVLCQFGGRLSPHMAANREIAAARGIQLVDLTLYGREVPSDPVDRRSLEIQLSVARSVPRRRVWLPPIEPELVTSLRAARRALSQLEEGRRVGSPYEAALDLFDTIITAATPAPPATPPTNPEPETEE